MAVDAPPQLGEVVAVGRPEAAADEGLFWLAVDVVAGVGAFAAGSRECCREMRLERGKNRSGLGSCETEASHVAENRSAYLVRRWVFAEPDISVNAERDVLDW